MWLYLLTQLKLYDLMNIVKFVTSSALLKEKSVFLSTAEDDSDLCSLGIWKLSFSVLLTQGINNKSMLVS